MQSVDTTATFVYNENGLRVQKTVNGVVTKYTLHSKNVVHMTQSSNNLHFFYDAQNKPAVVVYNDIPYSYIKNLQGDIVAILDSTGTPVVNYVYDAWGRPISCSGIMANTLGKINPFRYRGYVYDEETGLYYLRSRYYVSANARFLNADIMFTNNLFAYCSNNVINCTDPMGTEEEWLEGWIEPLRKSPRWGTAVDGEQMSVFYFVNGLHYMVNDVVDGKKGWKYRSNMGFGYVDCIGGARFMGQQFFKNSRTLDANIRATASGIRANNLSRLEDIDPTALEEITYGAVLFTLPDKKGKRHMAYYIGSHNGYEHCIIETTGKGDRMHYANLEERLYNPETGHGFYEWGELACVDYSGVCGSWIALPYDIPSD